MEVMLVTLTLMLGDLSVQATKAQQATTVLFMCPHGAAKSLIASAYFQKMAKERGLNVRVDSAEPSPMRSYPPAGRRADRRATCQTVRSRRT